MTTSYVVRFFFSAAFRSTWEMFSSKAVSWPVTSESTFASCSSS